MTTLPIDAPADLSLTHLDEDWVVPCERAARANVRTHCGGENPAAWVLWIVCGCTNFVLYCTACKDAVLGMRALRCPSCGRITPPAAFYRLIEPLNRRTT